MKVRREKLISDLDLVVFNLATLICY